MRTSQGWWCDTRNNPDFPGCEEHAAISWTCVVEGREIGLCNSCNRAWRERAMLEPELSPRCPLCSHVILPVTTPARQPIAGHELTGPIAEAINDAMYREGILVDVRARVLRRLGAQDVMMASVEFVDMWHKNRTEIAAYIGDGNGRSLCAPQSRPAQW